MRDNELETLSRYKRGAIVSAGDESLLERFASMDMCRIGGITTNTEDGIPRQTAKLTPEGLEAIRMEKIYRSPVKRVLYMVYNAVFG